MEDDDIIFVTDEKDVTEKVRGAETQGLVKCSGDDKMYPRDIYQGQACKVVDLVNIDWSQVPPVCPQNFYDYEHLCNNTEEKENTNDEKLKPYWAFFTFHCPFILKIC